MVRKLGSVLIAACLLLAGFSSPGAASVRPGRPAIKVSVDWPKAPVRSKTVTVHVTRADARPTKARLQMRVGTQWVLVKEKFVAARAFVFKTEPSLNRTMLRVVLPQRHVASHAFAAPQPAPLVRRASYADGAVWSTVRGQAVTLLFAGKRGQDVQLATSEDAGGRCRYARLRGPSGLVAQGRQGLWHLPRTGSYRFEVVPCWGHGYGRTSVDVSLVRLVPLTLDAAPVVLRRSVGVTEIGVVTLPSTGRVMVRGWQYEAPLWTSLTTPRGVTVGGYSASPVYLEAGKTLTDGYHTDVMAPGRYLFQPAADSLKVNASTAVTTTVTPEGPAATLGDEGVPGRERTFTFTGTAGSFVYPEPELPSFRSGDSAGSGSLVGPDGATVPDWNFSQGWLLPSDGTYTLRVTPSLAATWAGTPLTMRVRQAVSVPTMAYDVPTRFTVEQPDRWIVARVDVPNGQYSHRFTSSGSTMTGAWEAIAGWSTTNYCWPGPGPNGCGENFYTPVTQDVPEASYRTWGGSTPTVVVLRPGAGVTGGVDLAVRPQRP